MAEPYYLNLQPSTSCSTQIQITGLFATVSTLETTSCYGETGSTNIGRRRTSKTVLQPSTSDNRTITGNFGQNTPFTAKAEVETSKTLYFNSQPSTSYSTSVQCTGLSANVSTLETISGHAQTGSSEI